MTYLNRFSKFALGILVSVLGFGTPASAQEVGSNDFRISFMGPNGNTGFFAARPQVAYNSVANEYLVVWDGDDDTSPLVNDEQEIFGQRFDASGVAIGSRFRISDAGPDGNIGYEAFEPVVAYNSTNNEYLVVWSADDNTGSHVDNEHEIMGQRLDASGNEIGTNDFRISNMGPDASSAYSARQPQVAYNSTANEYLVVWHGDDNNAPLVDDEQEVFGQRVSNTGGLVGSRIRISDAGPNGNIGYEAFESDVVYNSTANEYLVVWVADDDGGSLVDNEYEIRGQRLDASGVAAGTNDFRISDMGSDGSSAYFARRPKVAYNSTANEYLVVWDGDDNNAPLVDDEQEVFGQRVTVAGAEIGTNDFRISDAGPDGNTGWEALQPDVAYDATNNQYLVVWRGDDDIGSQAQNENEIRGQRLDATGAEIGGNDIRLSDAGPDGDSGFEAYTPAVMFNTAANEYLIVWDGDDDISPLVNNEHEIFGQRFAPGVHFTELAGTAGINSSSASTGQAWADYDGDNDQDVYVSVAAPGVNLLYRNNGNSTFTDVASGAGVAITSHTISTSWADYDNDGDLDLYLVNGNEPNALYANNGSGSFTVVSGQATDSGNGTGQAWADYDLDGDADLFVSNFGTTVNRLYRNNNDNTFTDVASSTGMADLALTAGASWGDYDDDGDPDLYVGGAASANKLYRNDGAGTFAQVASSAFVDDGGNTRGVVWGDIDNDGDLDLYSSNDLSTNKMYKNNGNGTFTSTGGVEEYSGRNTGVSFGDADNDGDVDVFVAGYSEGNKLFINDGTGSFVDGSSSAGIEDAGLDFGIVWVDYDNDGDLDVYVADQGGDNTLYRNNSPAVNWLKVDLTGTSSGKDAFGARVDVHMGATVLRGDVNPGTGYMGFNPSVLHFGLGSSSSVDSVLVRWPSGIEQDRSNVSINQTLALTEADEAFVSIPDVTASYSSSVQVPIRIDEDISGKNVVAAEISVTFDNSVVTLGSPDKTEIVGSMVAAGWSVEENVFAGVGGIDTLSIAMSTAADTLSGTGDLIYIKFDVANIRHPASTPLNLVSVLFNEGSPSGVTTNGSLTIIGTDGSIVASPDSINPADVVTVTITDADFDVDIGSADQVTATAVSKVYGDTETVTLTETGVNTGVFTGTLNTLFSLVADPSQNGTLGTVAGDSICVSYVDSLDSAGVTVTRQDTVEVIGGTDGVVVTTYVVQAFDGRNGVRDTVRVEVADADLDTDVGVAEQVSATITNAISGEIEGVTLTETGLNTGVFQVRVPTIAGASGTNNDGELSLASWDTLDVSYNDALSSQGGANVVQEITRVVNLFGDVRVNDQVQAFDAARLLAISVGLISSNTQTTLVGDVDGNNSIQAFDASRVLQYVVRLIDRFGVQTDFTADPKNHPFEKPVPLGNVIALGDLEAQGDGTFLLPVSLSEREGILSGTLTLGVDAGVDVVDVDLANDYGSFMVAHNMTTEGLKVAFAGSQSELAGSGDVLMLRVRGVEGSPIRLSLDHVVLNGQTLTPSVNIEAMEEVITQAPELITELHQNIPNPFNPQTTIKYAIAEAGQVEMVIYSVTGQRIRTLISEFQDVGSYQIVWDGKDAVGRDVSSGVYLMRMQATGFVQTKKMMLLR